jgi:hypothetical protein
MVPPGGAAPVHEVRPGEAGGIEVPGKAAAPDRAQQALQQGEERPDPGAEERHQSGAY